MGDLTGDPPPPTHRWSEIQRLGLLDGIKSLADYERLITIGSLLADEYLRQFRPDPFTVKTAQIVHLLMFGEVYPWAGKFRAPSESVIVSGFPGADSWRIGRELQLLEIQVSRFGHDDGTRPLSSLQTGALRCVFHHVRFERIHPFRDGNGRVGRHLLGAAARERIDPSLMFDWALLRNRYFDGLNAANRLDLAPMANLLLSQHAASAEMSEYKAPFKVAPRMFEELMESSLEDDFEWSKVRPT